MCTGVIENILLRVLDAFQAVMQQCLSDVKAGQLVVRHDVGLIMATEPDAVLLQDAMQFYVPKTADHFDGVSFISALRSPGETSSVSVAQ